MGALVVLASAGRVARAYAVTQSDSLRRLAAGFVLLGGSQLLAAALQALVVAAPDALDRKTFGLDDLLFWAYYATLLLGLLSVFASFGRRPFRWAPALTLLLWAGPVLELATVVVLFFVVLHAGLNHIARKGPGSLLVAVGFFLLLSAHFLNLTVYAPLEPRWIGGEAVHLLGLLLLWWAVHRARSKVDA